MGLRGPGNPVSVAPALRVLISTVLESLPFLRTPDKHQSCYYRSSTALLSGRYVLDPNYPQIMNN